jgi:hypothetical protein
VSRRGAPGRVGGFECLGADWLFSAGQPGSLGAATTDRLVPAAATSNPAPVNTTHHSTVERRLIVCKSFAVGRLSACMELSQRVVSDRSRPGGCGGGHGNDRLSQLDRFPVKTCKIPRRRETHVTGSNATESKFTLPPITRLAVSCRMLPGAPPKPTVCNDFLSEQAIGKARPCGQDL